MNPKEYQKLAERTDANLTKGEEIKSRFVEADQGKVRFLHACLGLAGEVGELNYALEKFFYYGQEFDYLNAKEELGDICWYLAQACNALGLTIEEVMQANIRKLQKRFPDKFDEQRAKEENRDREAEAKKLRAGDDGVDYEG